MGETNIPVGLNLPDKMGFEAVSWEWEGLSSEMVGMLTDWEKWEAWLTKVKLEF